MKNKAIIFDLDGTLWNTTNQTLTSFNTILKKYNYEETTKKKVCENFGNNKEETLKHFFPFLRTTEAEKLFSEISNTNIENLNTHGGYIYHGVSDTLELLYQEYDLYIVSNCEDKNYIEAFLKTGNFYKYFKDYIAASAIPLPKGEAILKVINDNYIDKAIYVGDTESDRIAAKIANVPFIQCLYGFGEDLNCQYKINDISELYNCVTKIFKDSK